LNEKEKGEPLLLLIKNQHVRIHLIIISIQNSLSLISIQPTLKDMRKLISNVRKFFFPNVDEQEDLSTFEISLFILLLASVVLIAIVYI